MHMSASWLPLRTQDLGPAQPLGLAEDWTFTWLTDNRQLSGNDIRNLGYEEWADIWKVGQMSAHAWCCVVSCHLHYLNIAICADMCERPLGVLGWRV